MVNGSPFEPSGNAEALGALLGIADGDSARGRESYRAWTVGMSSSPFWPFYCAPARHASGHGECDDLGCWYHREGFKRCADAVDGVCILAHKVP